MNLILHKNDCIWQGDTLEQDNLKGHVVDIFIRPLTPISTMPPLRLTLTATLLLLATGFSKDYLPPGGGWDYLFEGNAAASSATEALDGTWNHNNSSDQWGERLTLLSSQEDPIRDFSYDNSAPWPTASRW